MNLPDRAQSRWERSGQEPRLEEMLADPMIELVMKRDGLTRDDLVALVQEARRRIGRRGRRAAA